MVSCRHRNASRDPSGSAKGSSGLTLGKACRLQGRCVERFCVGSLRGAGSVAPVLPVAVVMGRRFWFRNRLGPKPCRRFAGETTLNVIQPVQSNPMSNTTIRRRKSLVDPEVQGGVLRKIATHWVLFFICNTIALMIWIRLFEQPDADWGQTLGDTLRRFLPFFIITMALIPAFVWDTLKLTNRFAGPILRLRAALSDASDGRAVAPLHFRTNDFWQEIATNFNAVMERCDTSVTSLSESDDDAPSQEA